MKDRWSLVLALVIAVVAVAGVLFYGYYSWGFTTEDLSNDERLVFTSYSVNLTANGEFVVRLGMKNVLRSNLLIIELLINGVSWNEQTDTVYQNVTGIALAPRLGENGVFVLKGGYAWSSGSEVWATVRTLSGHEYNKYIGFLPEGFPPLPRFEGIEFTSVSQYLTPDGDFVLKLTLTNIGAGVNATINEILAKRISWYRQGDLVYENITGMTLRPDQSESGILILRRGDIWTDGVELEIIIRTVSGHEYPKMITLL